jgi:4-hydroxy-tetrahydrodipicolinate synthase
VTSIELVDGVYAAALTPMTSAGIADHGMAIGHCRWLLENGCDGLAPLGTTGEANSQSLADRMALIEAISAAGIPANRVVIGTGGCALGDTVALTRCAVDAGFPNALVLPPFYYKGVSDDGLFAYFAALIERVAEPRLRLYLYHFPKMSTVPLSAALIGRLREAFGDVVAGLKDSSGDWANTQNLIDTYPGFRVFSGSEEFLSANVAAGGPGCISATVNVTAPLAARVLRAGPADRERLQRDLTALRLVLQGFATVPALKRIMEWHTGNPAWRNILPPLLALSAAESADLRRALAEFPLFRDEVSLSAMAE